MLKLIKKYKNLPLEARVSVAYAVCSILQRCMSFVTLPLFTRILTTKQYGQYNIYTSWMAILTIFITLNLSAGSFSKAMVKFEERRDEYIASVQGITTLLGLLFFVLYFPVRNLWNKLFELPTALVLLMIVEIVAQSSILCWNGKKRFEFKYKAVVAITLLMTVISPILAFVLVINTEEKGYARIVGYATIVIIAGTIIYISNWIKGKKFYNKELWSYALGFNVPLIVYYLSQVIFNHSDKIMISHMCGTDKAGIYGVAYSLAIILNFVLNSINNSYQPWFYGRIKKKEEYKNKRIANLIAVVMAFLLLGVIALAPEIIKIMAGNEYTEAVWIVPPVAGSILLLLYSQFSINIEFYYERKKKLIYASIFAALINIVLNYICIPIFGYVAAGYTTWVSYIIFAVMNYLEMRKILKDINQEQNMYDVKFLMLLFLVFTILSCCAMALYSIEIVRYIIVVLVLSSVIILRKKLVELYKSASA